jgi:hypothetical protein
MGVISSHSCSLLIDFKTRPFTPPLLFPLCVLSCASLLNDAVLPSLVRRAKRRALEQGEEVEQHREFVARIIFYEEEISTKLFSNSNKSQYCTSKIVNYTKLFF